MPLAAKTKPPKTPAAASEIDDIFGSSSGSKNAPKRTKSTGVTSNALPTSAIASKTDSKSQYASTGDSASTSTKTKKKKSKKEKLKRNAEAALLDEDDNTGANASADPTSSPSDTKIGAEPAGSAGQTTKKRAAPVTVVDPSIRITAIATASATAAKKRRVAAAEDEESGPSAAGRLYVRRDDDDDERFRDSRGTGPRRRTEEGFAIYKEDELGLHDEGGDTPLCPFDCDCCF